MENNFLSQLFQPKQPVSQPEIDLAPVQPRVQPPTQKPIDYAGFRQFVFKKVPNITADQVKQLDDVIANRQRQELVRQGVLDVSELAKTDPGAAVSLSSQGFTPKADVSAEQEKQQMKLSDVAANIKVLEENLGQVGMKGPVLGKVASGITLPVVGNVGINQATGGALFPEAADYETLRLSLIGPLARAISGEVGQLTDRDIARAEGLLPKLTDAEQLRKNKLANLKSILATRMGNVGMGMGGVNQTTLQNNDPLGLGF